MESGYKKVNVISLNHVLPGALSSPVETESELP